MTDAIPDISRPGVVPAAVQLHGNKTFKKTAHKLLTLSAQFWFLVAVVGQGIFAYYIIAFYGGSAVQGNLEAWAQVLPHGYVEGQTAANLALASHLLIAAVITIGGPLQLIPQVRARVPVFHHWNGRVYIVSAFVASIGGLYMVWTGGAVGGLAQHISINAVLIMLCAAMALRYAMARKITIHRRWALRLFLVVSGVWFFRVGLMLWLGIHKAPVGFDPDAFQGPFLTFLSFAQYLLPLAILEFYLRARDGSNTTAKLAVSGTLVVLTLAMGFGISVATMGMWLPRIT